MADAESSEDGVGDTVYLRQITRSERGEDCRNCKETSNPVAGFNLISLFSGNVEPFLHEVHRATCNHALLVEIAILVRQCHLYKFCTHAQKCGKQHPEDSCGSPQVDGQCHSGNISSADRPR